MSQSSRQLFTPSTADTNVFLFPRMPRDYNEDEDPAARRRKKKRWVLIGCLSHQKTAGQRSPGLHRADSSLSERWQLGRMTGLLILAGIVETREYSGRKGMNFHDI